MNSSGPSSSSAVNEGSQQDPHPSQVGISSFVSIKLFGETNYDPWKEQMMCFLEYHDKIGFVDGTIKNPFKNSTSNTEISIKEKKTKYREWRKLDTLVKGWIFGTLSEDVMGSVLGLDNANELWEKLASSYDNSLMVVEAELIFTENENVAVAKYKPLCRAIVRGDWDEAQEFFNKDTATLTAKINYDGDSALHLAVFGGQNIRFVENLLKQIPSESLPTLVDYAGSTTLDRAAIVGYTDAAKKMVEKNPSLLFIADDRYDSLPIFSALYNYQEETFRYLYKASKLHIGLSHSHRYQNPFEGTRGSLLFGIVIDQGYLDIAYDLICEYPNLAISKDETSTPLWYIVQNQHLYLSATRYNSYQRFIYSHVPIEQNILENDNMISDIENPKTYSTEYTSSCFYLVPHTKHLHEKKLNHNYTLKILERICEEIGKINNRAEIYNQYCTAFHYAILNDIPEAVEMIISFIPQEIWTENDGNNILQIVTMHRCEMVLNFLEGHVLGGNKLFLIHSDVEGNNILHLAGRLAPIEKLNMVSGAALQMQREVQWFKRVEKCILPYQKEQKNLKGQTPIMVFREEHKNLRKEGEEWIKKTSDSYTITAALIITIVFAAAITVPGGNDQNTGKPIYTTHASFIIFAISDAISLFTSTTSLLLFLSILTARYNEDDFLYKLPKRLILGLVMLFLSVTSMMVAFGATLYIMFGQGKEWILIPIATLACLPIGSYVILQYPLLLELVSSTYGHGIYNKKK